MRNVLHIPSLKKEEEDPRRSKVVWSNQRFDHHSLNSICPSLQCARPSMLCNMLGERSQKSLLLVILRDLPHTYSCTCFIKKTKVETNKDSTGTPASLNLLNRRTSLF